MLDPIMFPIAISLFFLYAATTEVASSGNEVPAATKVNPTSFSLTPIMVAIYTALVTTIFPPAISAISPIIIKRQIFHIGRLISLTSSTTGSLLSCV